MFARSMYPRATATTRSIDRSLRSLEQRLGRARGRVSASAVQSGNQVGEAVASVLDRVADRFRDGAFEDQAAKIGAEAAKIGNDALRRLSREVEARPLVTLAVAVGIGVLVGVLSGRRSRA
jgi:ElaB/YqjD/DUF883 family membrane-anchored ribosome-binding protein